MTGPSHRLAEGGAIDRDRRLSFTFDRRSFHGHPGDTLASALLANGVGLLGRSFKYHRPRGLLALGSAEPNALMSLRTGARQEPNIPATMVELYDGLVAESQNRFPSLALDLMAVNQLLAPFIPAGFYYKTFMWPGVFWERVYEKAIRRAAGLGRATSLPDPDRYDHLHHHCDVLVVGAGPAGLAAAIAAGRAGARVILADEMPWLGGSLAYERGEVRGLPVAGWIEGAEAALARHTKVTILKRSTVFGLYDGGVALAVERVSDHLPVPEPHRPRQRLHVVRAREVVLASGATERPLLFKGNDRPGVMLSTAARGLANRFAVAPGRRVVVATDNDDGYRTAQDLAAAGLEVVRILDARRDPGEAAERAREAGFTLMTEAVPGEALGGRSLAGVRPAMLDGGLGDAIDCDTLAMSGGFSPNIQLSTHLGASPLWNDASAAFLPPPATPRLRAAGAARAVFDLDQCHADGERAGAAAAAAAGFHAGAPSPSADPEPAMGRPPLVIETVTRGKAFVDFQHDVTADDLRLAHREGYAAPEHMKRYTTLGMATDQGRTASLNGLAVLASIEGRDVASYGPTRHRPPYSPVAIGAFVGHERGRQLQPTRLTAIHRWHVEAGAAFVEAGQWLRPRLFPKAGEDMMTGISREAAAVRRSVGVCDVSTLGKIEVFGPDAGPFLDRLYVNTFSKLPVGRARYGVMLREDGHAFDDGTTTRLAEDHFFMTTTTANAARVLQHMEHAAQVLWPELDVAFCSATEQWCGVAIAGPNARKVLEVVVDPGVDVSHGALPFMGVKEATIGGATARIFRISFSGELAFEIMIGWDWGEALWRRIMEAGAVYAIVPYGLEALGVLRIEKGHVTGSEIDGRTTLSDLGLGRMMAKGKSCIGKTLALRPGMSAPDRPTLVGLKPIDRTKRLRGGAHIVEDPATATVESALGWVTSVADSPALGHWIGLGFVKGGLARKGETLVAYHPLKGEAVMVEVTDPVFVDPTGERLHA